MAPRPNWKGFLKLSLVSCAVALYPATTTAERIRFHIINRKTGDRIRNDIVDAETGQPVEPEDRVKGYEFVRGQYVLLDEEELDNVALASTHTIEIDEFVRMADVDRIYLDESFYLVPQEERAQEAFAVIREAMRKQDLVGIARVVIYRRERLLLVAPRGKGLMATALRYKTEVRDEKNYFADIPDTKVPADMLKLGVQILESKTGRFNPDKFEDRYETALKDLVAAKRAGKAPPVVAEPRPSNVINLMDALRRSVKPGETPVRKAARPARNARKRINKKVKKAG